MIPSVRITMNFMYIEVREEAGVKPIYLTPTTYDSFVSHHPDWALVQAQVLEKAQLLGWSP